MLVMRNEGKIKYLIIKVKRLKLKLKKPKNKLFILFEIMIFTLFSFMFLRIYNFHFLFGTHNISRRRWLVYF